MKANQQSKIQFINSPYLVDDTLLPEEQRRVHSHAARTAHAKARRLRTAVYQASKLKQMPQDSQDFKEKRVISVSSSSAPSTLRPVTIRTSLLLSPVSLLASDRRDPFGSFARSFLPIEHFLLDHYVRAVIPFMNITCNKLKDPEKYVDLMTKEWVRLTVTNVGSLNGIFLAACRHLLQYKQWDYTQLAIQYKFLCVQALREAIISETSSIVSDSTVTLNILLAYDELQLGDFSTFECHAKGLIKIVEHNGGPQTMGTNGFLERLVCKFIGNIEQECKFALKPW